MLWLGVRRMGNQLVKTTPKIPLSSSSSSLAVVRFTNRPYGNQAPYSYTDAELSRRYNDFRPNYDGSRLHETILGFCNEHGSGVDLAVDVGCGNGQGTWPLAKYFKKVVGVDSSEVQIAKASRQATNISYMVSAGEDLGFVENGSVDLVTASMCLHYLDHDKFYKEADRVLKPRGCLAVYCYSPIGRLSHPEVNAYFSHVTRNVILPYWTAEEKTLLDGYRSVSLSYPGWRRDDSLSVKKEYTVKDLIGYLESFRPLWELDSQQPERNISREIKANLLSCVRKDGLDTKVHAEFPVFLLMGSKPESTT